MDEITYNCLIVDDEPIAIRVIKNHMASFKNLHLAGECSNAIEAMELLARTKVDLIFLDIQMPQITGIDFLKTIDHPPKVIFTTAYRDYAFDAFDLDVVDYLLKPISLIRFSKAINRFYQRMQERAGSTSQATPGATTDFIFIKADKKLLKVFLTDIIYIEALGDYLRIHTTTGKITTKERITAMEEQLPAELFLRVHRGYIIAIGKITALLPGLVELGTSKVPIGRSYKQQIELLRNKQ